MKILVLNCGSSSIKYKLFDMTSGEVMAQGGIEKIGLPGAAAGNAGRLAAKTVAQNKLATAPLPNRFFACFIGNRSFFSVYTT